MSHVRIINSISEEQVREGSEMTNKKYGQRMIPSKCVIFVTEEKDVFKKYEIVTKEEAGNCNNVVITKGEGGVLSDDLTTEDSNELSESQTEISNILDRWLKTGDCCSASAKRLNWGVRQILPIL